MNEENENIDNEEEEIEVDTMNNTSKGGVSAKVLIIGVPLFIIQLVAVYFITANYLLENVQAGGNVQKVEIIDGTGENNGQTEEDSVKKPVAFGQFIYSVDDIIVNPAGTNGQQLLLTSIAFDLGREEDKQSLEGKEVVIKDMIISVLSSKDISHLSNTAYKDSLRSEISQQLEEFAPDVLVNKVYFSKYIIN